MGISLDTKSSPALQTIRLGLRENWSQFSLLVLVNAFVGGMVGIERVILPLLAETDFSMASRAAILSFIVTFGLVKATTNLLAGRLSDRLGRKRVLVAGWLFGLPVPLIILLAPSWQWVVWGNMLLGINQGLCWSVTVIMKIDLVGPQRRGLAMGFNEASGYLAVALTAFASGHAAGTYGLRPGLFYIGEALAVGGLVLSGLFVRESLYHARYESKEQGETQRTRRLTFSEIFWLTSWKDRALFSASQAGTVNNMNDGLAWGLLPLYFASQGLSLGQVSILGAIYPGVWGIAQLATGGLSDHFGRKGMIAGGMIVQAGSIFVFLLTRTFLPWLCAAFLLGLGTAMVYPTLLAAIGDVAAPSWRASSVGVYRLWRDGGYAAGALLAGAIADLYGMRWAIGTLGALTLLSGIIVARFMYETHPRRTQPQIERP